MAIKKQITRLYKFRNKRPYRFIKTKQGKGTQGLGASKILTYKQGNLNFEKTKNNLFSLASSKNIVLPEVVVESLRVNLNRKLSNNIGKTKYTLRLNRYPHEILRYHRMATGAGADRVSEGMRLAFGEPLCRAIRLKENDVILQVFVSKSVHVELIRKYILASAKKLPCKNKLWVSEN